MKNQNFYMRVISLLLVVLAVLFYNSSMKAQANEKEIAALTDKVDTLQEQQNELLSALETSYANRVANQAASSENSNSDAADSGETADNSDNNASDANAEEASSDSDNVYKDGTYTGEGQGYGGTIQVEVTLASDEITSINVVSAPGEDSAYLSQGEGVIDSVLSAQSTDVDTISGATFSSTGILNAIDDALGKAENS